MCIVNAMPVKLTEPKKVYKVFILAVDENGNETIHSPYRTFQTWKVGVRNSEANSEGAVRQALRIHYKDWSTVNELHGGAFHTLVEKEDAQKMAELLASLPEYVKSLGRIFISMNRTFRNIDIAVGECTIPQNSEYVFEGDFETYEKDDLLTVIKIRSMASSNLIIDRILEDSKVKSWPGAKELKEKNADS